MLLVLGPYSHRNLLDEISKGHLYMPHRIEMIEGSVPPFANYWEGGQYPYELQLIHLPSRAQVADSLMYKLLHAAIITCTKIS